MIWLYRILFVPALLLLATPYYLWRMRRRGGYGENFGHRFGGTDALPAKKPGVRRIWLQAVSVGEMLAIAPLLEAFHREGRTEVYLTTTTSTGYKLAKEKYQALTVGIGYFPLDFWAFSARAWRRVQPDLCILMEGERWPEHVHQAAANPPRAGHQRQRADVRPELQALDALPRDAAPAVGGHDARALLLQA